ncbi:acyl carrier protein [Mortierella sp. AD094]|nr:acyl carrier protein [Mortierella sp. AD094]
MFRVLRPSAAMYRNAVLYKNPAVFGRNAMALNFARSYASALSRSDIEERVISIMTNVTGVILPEDTLNTSFSELGLDSMSHVEVLTAIENNFSIEIPSEELVKIRSAAQIVEYISKLDDAK